MQAAEKVRQLRSRFVQILNGDPATSPLGGAHRLGAPYSSHRAHQRVRLGPSLAAALPAERRILARRGWVGEKSGFFEHPAGVLFTWLGLCRPSNFCFAEWVFPSLLGSWTLTADLSNEGL